jgi:hypothetical protein
LNQSVGTPVNKHHGGRFSANDSPSGPQQIWFEDWVSDTRYNSRHSQVYTRDFINPIGDFNQSGAANGSVPTLITESIPELLPLPNW